MKSKSTAYSIQKGLFLFKHSIASSFLIAILMTIPHYCKGQTIYVADQYSTSGSGAIYTTTPGGSNVVLYTGGLLNGSINLCFDSSGDMFVANYGPIGSTSGTTVTEITPGGVQSTFASGLSAPAGMAFDNSGNLWVTNVNTNAITVFNSAGTVINTITGLNGPVGMAFNSSGNLFVANYFNNSVSEYSPTGSLINSSYVTGVSGPTDVAFDGSGNMFVCGKSGGVVNEYYAVGGSRTVASGITGVDCLLVDKQGDLFFGTAVAATG